MTNAPGLRGPGRRRGLHRHVVDLLGKRIVGGELQPGDSLPNEDDLSAELQVSRTVVREAVKVLAAKGLVDARPRIGTRVLRRAEWNLIDPDVLGWQLRNNAGVGLFRDLAEVRALIEPKAAALAAQRRNETDGKRLAALVEQLDGAVAHSARYVEVDLALHGAILEATHNELLARMTGTLEVALEAGRVVSSRIPGGTAGAMAMHRAVVDAIVAGDAPAAEEAMTRLVVSAARDVEHSLGRGDETA